MQSAELDEKDSRVLWIAVVENAIRDSMLTKRTVRQSARHWLLADQEDFPYVCELAGLDDVYLRNLVKAKIHTALGPPQ